MRRKERLMTPEAAAEVLAKANWGTLSFLDNGAPAAVPLNYGYADGVVYFHGAMAGRKFEALKRDPRAVFTVVTRCEVVIGDPAFRSSARYESVMVTGEVKFLDDPADKAAALDCLMRQIGVADPVDYPPEVLAITAVFRLAGEIVGKAGRD